jgi:phytoene synthase
MPVAQTHARRITRRAKSNLAFALASLPSQRRQDMETFYAFCRLVDDLADDEGVPLDERRAGLDAWRRAVREEHAGEDPLASGVREVRGRYEIPVAQFDEIIRGVEMDLTPHRFETVAETDAYCRLVASVVGLVSIEIFGYKDPGCRDYAEALGLALQWTNILRDVGEDAGNGRVYLPEEDLATVGLGADDLLNGTATDKLGPVLETVYQRAVAHYARAESVLPSVDKRSMVAAETMRRIYRALLEKMRRDGFRVLEKRYRLGKTLMVGLLLATRIGL